MRAVLHVRAERLVALLLHRQGEDVRVTGARLVGCLQSHALLFPCHKSCRGVMCSLSEAIALLFADVGIIDLLADVGNRLVVGWHQEAHVRPHGVCGAAERGVPRAERDRKRRRGRTAHLQLAAVADQVRAQGGAYVASAGVASLENGTRERFVFITGIWRGVPVVGREAAVNRGVHERRGGATVLVSVMMVWMNACVNEPDDGF